MHVHDGVHVYIAYDIDAKLRTTWLTSATDHIRANSIVILLKSHPECNLIIATLHCNTTKEVYIDTSQVVWFAFSLHLSL